MEAEERALKIKEREKQIKERDINDLKKVIAMPEGRRLLWRILELSETFGTRATDKRIVGLKLFAEIMEADPEKYLQMQREYKSEKISLQKQFPIDPEED